MEFIFRCKNCGQRIINYEYNWLVGNKVEIRWKHFRNDLSCPKAEKGESFENVFRQTLIITIGILAIIIGMYLSIEVLKFFRMV